MRVRFSASRQRTGRSFRLASGAVTGRGRGRQDTVGHRRVRASCLGQRLSSRPDPREGGAGRMWQPARRRDQLGQRRPLVPGQQRQHQRLLVRAGCCPGYRGLGEADGSVARGRETMLSVRYVRRGDERVAQEAPDEPFAAGRLHRQGEVQASLVRGGSLQNARLGAGERDGGHGSGSPSAAGQALPRPRPRGRREVGLRGKVHVAGETTPRRGKPLFVEWSVLTLPRCPRSKLAQPQRYRLRRPGNHTRSVRSGSPVECADGRGRCGTSRCCPLPTEDRDPSQTFRRSACWRSDRTRMTEGGRKLLVGFEVRET